MTQKPNFELSLTRRISALPERVFDAFVAGDQLSQWCAPRGMTVPKVALDARVGQGYRLTMEARDRSTFTVTGEYRELVRPTRIAYTWQWVDEAMAALETLVLVELRPCDEGTELVLTHSGFSDPRMRDAHIPGWNSSLNRLVEMLDPRGTAANLALSGDPRSTYTWSVRIALAEKGLHYEMVERAPHSAEQVLLHPFGRIPALRDGDFVLFETSAIVRYLDECFPEPVLIPASVRARARAEQWVSATSSYLYDAMIRRYVLQYLFPKGPGGEPDAGVIAAARVEITRYLAILDDAYGEHNAITGETFSIADLVLAPIIDYLALAPGGKELLAAAPNVSRALASARARPSFQATHPSAEPAF